jgi:DNA polymerase (family 10)
VTNGEIARILANMATMLEIEGANPFRVRAYREAARVVETSPDPVATLVREEKRLEGLRGIGKDLAAKIRDLIATGTTPAFEDLKARVPLDLVELTGLPGLGPKRVKAVFDALGVRTRAELEAAARAGKLAVLPGFGTRTQAKLIEALAAAPSVASGRMLLPAAWEIADTLLEAIRAVPGVKQAEVAGSFRRRCETIGDLDVLACGGSAESVMDAFVRHRYAAETLGRGDTRSSIRLGNGLQVDLRHVAPECFGAAMLYFTGSKAHNIELRRIAIDQGMSLSEYGLTRGEEIVAARTEEEVYRALGMPWIPPELREGQGEIALARQGALPRLVELSDIRGDLHMHTNRTDGREPLEVMVRAARDRGYEYVAITDHSQAVAMAFGFDEERVRRSADEIAEVRRQVPGIEVLHGLEVDILADGALDLADHALALLDWVVVSLHSRLDQPGPVITERVLRALDHPAVCAMGHPTARYISRRAPAALDLERVFERAVERGVAMEINSQPDRIDLNDVNARLALAKGAAFVIDTDAHWTAALDYMRFGVFAARRAGLSAAEVLNARGWAEFDRGRRRPARALAAAGRDVAWPHEAPGAAPDDATNAT